MKLKTKGGVVSAARDVTSAELRLKIPANATEAEVLTDTVIILAGPEHDVRRRMFRDRRARALASVERNGRLTMGSLEEQESDELEEIVASTLGWRELLDDEGNPIPYSADAARKLYEDREYTWIREQVKEFLGQRANFIRRSVLH